MKVDLYERIWLWAAALMIAAFLAAVIAAAALRAVHPPSHVETIDPVTVRTETEFSNPGVEIPEEGPVRIVVVAELYQFRPGTMRVPAGRPVKFRLTSPDVIHGFQIVGTNANVIVAPGYVSQFTVTFPRPGEFLVVCNEFCGLAHHLMQGRLIVEGGAE